MSTDKIEKRILLHASRERAWQALADSTAFGHWFGMRFEGAFSPGASARGVIVPTRVDDEVAQAQKPYAGLGFEILIEAMEPSRLFSLRWHPFAIDPAVDYSAEPMTLVEFRLEEVQADTLLTVVESGFDRLPPERRAKAFAANEGGWGMALKLLEKYLAAG